ncbi:MAG TPA: ATP-binding protein [Myxococcota bacterium]|nr:ATP-binding protein [Myxococcota bacterium]HRY94633.1 ATP-binding protein [Myxococcota bacterium]
MTEDLAQLAFLLTNLVTAGILVILAFLSWARGARTPVMRLWIAFCIIGSVYAGLLIYGSEVESSEGADVLIRAGMTAGDLAILIFVLFACAFSSGLSKLRWLWLPLGVWGLALLPVFWATDWIMGGAEPSAVSNFAPVAGSLMGLYMAYILLGFGSVFALALLLFRRSTGLRRTQAAYMLVAFACFGVGASGSLLPALLGRNSFVDFLPALVLPLGPLIITVAMIRHRLWDVRTVLHRTAGWLVALAALLVPLYALLWLIGPWLRGLARLDATLLLSLLFLAGFAYLRALKPRVDRLFQRSALDQRRELDLLAHELASLRSVEQACTALLESAGKALFPRSACLWVRPRREGAWRVFAWPPGSPAPACPEGGPLDPGGELGRFLASSPNALGRDHLAAMPGLAGAAAEAEGAFARVGAEVAVPLVQAGALVGLLTLAEKGSLKPYTRGDFEFLDSLGAAAATGLSNALLFDETDTQRRTLAEMAAGLERRVAERTAELEDANLRLRELDQLKSRFFANISHELRTPLCLILSPLEAMLEEGLGRYSGEQRQELDGLKRNALVLLKLIDDLLDLSRLEDARLRLRLEEVDLAGLVALLVETARPLAERKRLRVELTAGPRPMLEADPEKLERVVVNLLSNALKFTDPGGRVELEVGEDPGPPGAAWLRVRDTGVGIPAEELGRIFDRFYQVDSSATRRRGGSGIGLSLARELAELHGGELLAESEPGRGSCFTVRLPLSADGLPAERVERRQRTDQVPELRREEDAGLPEWTDQIRASPDYRFLGFEEATERRVAPRRQDEGAKAARLLVVDDNPDVLRFLEQVLGATYDLWPVQDGERALALLEAQRHDLVVCDVMMPGMSGLELCRRVKTNPRLQDIPVLLLTARSADEGRIEGHQVGADHYLTKPFHPAELLAAIEALLARRVRESEVAANRRAASLETLLAGLAHELRNAAHQAQSAQQAGWLVARRALGANPAPALEADLGRMEDIARRALGRLSAVVMSLQRYAFRQLHVPWVELDLGELVRQEVSRLTSAEQKGVRLEVAAVEGVRLRGPQEELRQLVINLVENAVQATQPGGWVRVAVGREAGKARLVVEDNGCGIPPENRDRVFDLFFTTKDPGKGVGLGLALVKRTVTDLGGALQLDSEPGRGTRFSLELPSLDHRPEPSPEPPAPGDTTRRQP